MRTGTLLILILGILYEIRGQEVQNKLFSRDFFLKVDNDAFLGQAVDRYYSSGIFFKYRKLIPSESTVGRWGGGKNTKTIYSINFSHLFFTPSDLKLRTIDQFDRPYAGMMAAGFGVNYFNPKRHFQVQLDAGILGPGAGVRQLQEWYHRLINAKTPRGWRFQIENSPVITINAAYSRVLAESKKVQLLADANLQVGTIFNNIRPGLTFRWGNFQPLDNSALRASRLGSIATNAKKEDQMRESYLFVSTSFGYTLYDATIEGGFIGTESIHTESIQHLRYHIKYGWAISLRRWDMALSFNNVRRETLEARDHYYATIDLLMRF